MIEGRHSFSLFSQVFSHLPGSADVFTVWEVIAFFICVISGRHLPLLIFCKVALQVLDKVQAIFAISAEAFEFHF